jgi:hypothetical protein
MKEMVPTTTEQGEKAGGFKAFGERDIAIGGERIAANRG